MPSEITLITGIAKRVLAFFGVGGAARGMRESAANWLELAGKVWHYRRDQLSDAERRDLAGRVEALRQELRAAAEPAKLKLLTEELEDTLRQLGGRIYPKSALVENVEFFLVAAIVVLGIRTYFVQPFKIPTNSMWPSYYGMTPQVYRNPAGRPGPVQQVFRLVAFGARNYSLSAPDDGEVAADFFDNGYLAYAEVPGRHWLAFPVTLHEYTLYVNGVPAKVSVPEDFRFDEVVQQMFFGSHEAMLAHLRQEAARQAVEPDMVNVRSGMAPVRAFRIDLGKSLHRGDPLLSFDLLTGDQLFVDRLSYHFVRPAVGQGFVFRTDNIAGISDDGSRLQQYYIKRLVGLPGDTLEIKSYALYRNGQPITGAAAFGRNARREGLYPGYQNVGGLAAGNSMTVPEHSFLALGDNSANSKDGRYWGYVPAKDVVGRPLFIYYPFTRRWGPAR
jgi:signal peptidase I